MNGSVYACVWSHYRRDQQPASDNNNNGPPLVQHEFTWQTMAAARPARYSWLPVSLGRAAVVDADDEIGRPQRSAVGPVVALLR